MSERPTLSTWLQPPHTFWSFRHVRELVPTERIRRGDVVRELNPAPRPELLDVDVDTHFGRIPVRDVLGHERDALVVLHGDDLLVDWLADGVRADEPHLIFSVTKSVTGLLAGALAGAGKLDLDASPLDYLPEIADSGFADATLRQVLDMEASYAFVEDYTPGPDVVAYRHAAGWYPAPADAPSLQGFLASRAPEGVHGERFRYLSPTTDLMGWVCARAAGTTWAEAVSTYLWAPIGAEHDAEVTVEAKATTFSYRLRRDKLRQVHRREGRYLLRTNLTDTDPAQLWNHYLQLVQVEEAFKNLKGDLAIRPIYHQRQDRIEAHIFIAFLAYCVQVTLSNQLREKAPGLTARSVLEKFAAVQMIDVHIPTTDGREVVLTRYTQPERDLQLLLHQLQLQFPEQPPPRISAHQAVTATIV